MKNSVIIVLLFLVLLVSCSNTTTAGNGSETGNPIVMGTASLPDGIEVDSVTLVVRKVDEDQTNTDYSYLGDGFDENGVMTVPPSEFDFSLNQPGTYVVEVKSGDSLSSIQYVTVTGDRVFQLKEMVLDTLFDITGSVKLVGGDQVDILIYAEGLDRSVAVESDGSFVFPVPRGLVTLKVVPQSDQYRSVEVPYVQSGTTIDQVKILAIAPVATDYEGDSLIIRAILDSNGLEAIRVDQVTIATDGRIVEFDVVPDTSQVNLVDISGFITVIPNEIGGLSALKELEIQYTGLTSLPESIGQLTSLLDLELNDNHLTSLPKSIVNLTPTGELRLSRNFLSLDAEQTAWANQYDPDWAENQQ